MTKISKTIVFFGTEDFSLVALSGLFEAGYNIAAVVTKIDSKRGRGQTLSMPSVKQFAVEHNIPVWQPTKISEINDKIIELSNDAIGVLVSFGKIIPQSTIDLFNPGIINVHPSLLPKYRGATPIESAIENGDEVTGVSIMQLSYEMDAGPIYDQISYNLSGEETQPELYKTLAKLGTEKLLEVLPKIIYGSLIPTSQDNNNATYCSLLSKDNSWLKPLSVSAQAAERQVRAHLKFPKTKIEIFDKIIIINKAHISNSELSPLDIKCSDDKYLSIDELIAPSGRTMSGKDFLNGYN